MHLVIVESPAKAKTINKYLGRDYQVLASFGHIRDLPAKDGSVRPDEDFAMSWEVGERSTRHVREIAAAVKDADSLILATDPDREGEAISWHILETLAEKKALKGKPVRRVVFNAITKSAVTEAMKKPRDVDMELVHAYLARRALDYLVGFRLSPVLWRKLPGAKSAGRVQSVALRLITEREIEIEAFKAEEYWTLDALVKADAPESFRARLVTLDGQKLGKLDVKSEAEASRAKAAIEAATFKIDSVEAKPGKRNPAPPFTTSTLQQEASRKLGFPATRTMQAAQRLYEGVDIGGETVGLITYMRTDGVQMASEAIAEARLVIGDRHGPRYVPDKPRFYSTKAKNAQEAHEAVRPTSFARAPETLMLEGDLKRLYELIWKRAIASQMASVEVERTTIEVLSSDAKTGLRATGSVITFDGFIRVYREGRDDAEGPLVDRLGGEDDEGGVLPKVTAGAKADVSDVAPEQHFTQPPPRYTEASLVKALEEHGIGRPSTYASIINVLREREYVRMDKNRFIPEDKGRLVTAFLEKYFERYVQYDFTAGLEEKLDKVSAGELSWKELLREFWRDFSAAIGDTGDLRPSDVVVALDEALGPHLFPPAAEGEADPRVCTSCGNGRLGLKTGKFGAFIGCSNYPECRYTRQLGQSAEEAAAVGDGSLGTDPATGLEVALKTGRFGPYVQLGEGEKPKRSSLPKGWTPESLTLERALKLLALPRTVGPHPDDGEPILANLGRFGPYVQHGKTYANVESAEEVFEIGLNRAVALIADKRAGGGKRPMRGVAEPLKDLGPHPERGDPILVLKGRYGPYVKCGDINATLPKGMEPEAVTLEIALPLIAARADAAPSKGKRKAPAKPAAQGKAKTKAKTDADAAGTRKTTKARKPSKAASTSKAAVSADEDAAPIPRKAAARSKPAAARAKASAGGAPKASAKTRAKTPKAGS